MKNFYILYSIKGGPSKEHCLRASNPVTALDKFHQYIQDLTEHDPFTQESHRRYFPHDYKINRLFIRYHELDGEQRLIESDYDLPRCANPDVREPKTA